MSDDRADIPETVAQVDAAKVTRIPSEAARRALAEAEARRAAIDAHAATIAAVPEKAGRGGLEPVRYDDWEIAGRAVDF